MNRYIHTLQDVPAYTHHSASAQILQTLPAGIMVPYSREKRREGINWMEIFLTDGSKGYVKKNRDEIFICKYAELDDDEAQGFNYSLNSNSSKPFFELFTPAGNAAHTPPADDHLWIELKRIKDREKNRTEQTTLAYDPNEVTLTPFRLRKKNLFYVTRQDPKFKNPFIEVTDKNFNKGILLSGTSYTETKDKWLFPIFYIVVAAVTILTFLAILSTGWILIGFLLLIPGIIAGAIVAFVVKLVITILAGIFQQIRKRF